ncbi:MAG: alpha/beta fold hydrolase [Pseudomonadota bacterium]
MTLPEPETVRIPGPEGHLEGTLLYPSGATDIVIILPGSGPTDRDGNSPQGLASNTYKLIAQGLAAQGIAALRVDKRGLFGSAKAISDPNAVTIGDYAQDLSQWAAFAATRASRVWVAGHSEGGLVALYAAASGTGVFTGLFLMATPSRPLGQVLLSQLEAQGLAPKEMDAARALIAGFEAGQDPTSLRAIPNSLRPLFPPSLNGYWRDLVSHDPTALIKNWHGPALIIQGDADIQMGMDDAERLHGAAPNAERLDLDGGTHLLKVGDPKDPLATYRNPDLPLHPALLPGMRIRRIRNSTCTTRIWH